MDLGVKAAFTVGGLQHHCHPLIFNSRFIVLELEELKPTPHLQWVVLMSIIRAAQHAMFIKKDGRRRLFILDEAWEYIGESNGDDAAVNFFY
uniref:IncF plasmid conjugative transfer pilus assembly protein TraC n=1 Tax=Klebsiella pneumoniae TaxID=573 RepID=A0A8B0SS02_KLEPN|nr:IncF plasmid conjugative transfer pilus assembly protein TraC [Klebsiella pneumoniae]